MKTCGILELRWGNIVELVKGEVLCLFTLGFFLGNRDVAQAKLGSETVTGPEKHLLLAKAI